jgi:hypothetical protein
LHVFLLQEGLQRGDEWGQVVLNDLPQDAQIDGVIAVD